MLPVPVTAFPIAPRTRSRTALVASADSSFRQRLSETLIGLRWQVREAGSGAQAWSAAEDAAPEAVVLDSWLPDLDLAEFITDFRGRFPQTDLITASGFESNESPRGPFRQELLYALRRCQDTDTAVWKTAPELDGSSAVPAPLKPGPQTSSELASASVGPLRLTVPKAIPIRGDSAPNRESSREQSATERLPELVGNSPSMLEVSRRIRLVAPRLTPVLIEGPTGSGKELVAEALHRLSTATVNRLSPSIAQRFLKRCLKLSCSATPAVHLPARCRDGLDASSPPTGHAVSG